MTELLHSVESTASFEPLDLLGVEGVVQKDLFRLTVRMLYSADDRLEMTTTICSLQQHGQAEIKCKK